MEVTTAAEENPQASSSYLYGYKNRLHRRTRYDTALQSVRGKDRCTFADASQIASLRSK